MNKYFLNSMKKVLNDQEALNLGQQAAWNHSAQKSLISQEQCLENTFSAAPCRCCEQLEPITAACSVFGH